MAAIAPAVLVESRGGENRERRDDGQEALTWEGRSALREGALPGVAYYRVGADPGLILPR